MTTQSRSSSRSCTHGLIWRGLTCGALALVALDIPSVGAGQRPVSPAAPAEADTVAPPGVVESAYSFASGSLQLPGTLTVPARVSGKLPVAIIVAGSGPTDRNGNSLVPGVRPNMYAQLAWGLAQHGIATLRYDKRGLAAGGAGLDPTQVTLADFRDDVIAAARAMRTDARFSRVVLIGHSEGAGLVLQAANAGAPAAGVIMIAGMGRPLAEVLHDQLGQLLDSASLSQSDSAVARYLRGEDSGEMPPVTRTVLIPQYRKFLQSMAAYDAPAELRRAAVPVMLVYGSTDIQVAERDLDRLKAAKPEATVLVIPNANHVFKAVTSKARAQQLPAYANPRIPIVPELVPGIARWIGGLK